MTCVLKIYLQCWKSSISRFCFCKWIFSSRYWGNYCNWWSLFLSL